MKLSRLIFSLICLITAGPLFAQNATPGQSPAEASAFSAITDLLTKLHIGGENPSADDLKARREAGLQMAGKAREFVKNFPASNKVEDAQALLNIALCEAALAGDSAAEKELRTRVGEFLKDPKAPDMLKLHTFAVNYLTQWARQNGRHTLNQSSPEFQKANVEAFFSAINVLPNKDAIFKMLLLQAKADRQLSLADRQSIAQRVIDHPASSASLKAEARDILSGGKAYAIGKPLDLSFTAVDGKKVSLAELKGKVVLIDFWATWCGPCVAEVPAVKKVYDKYHPAGFEILGISLDESKDDLIRFTQEHEMPWPQYFDGKHWNNEISFRFGIDAVPTEWLVDRKGILRNTNARFDLDQAVAGLLDEK